MSGISITNPIDFTLTSSVQISNIFDVYTSIHGNIIYPVLSGVFDGASVIIEQFVSDFQGWLPMQWRQDETTSNTIIFTQPTIGDDLKLPPKSKFRFVCLNSTALTNIKVSIAY